MESKLKFVKRKKGLL